MSNSDSIKPQQLENSMKVVFALGLLLRLGLLFFPASGAMTDFFIPFMDKAIENPFTNPWSLSPGAFFPYGSALFLVMLPFKGLAYLLFGQASLGASTLSVISMKAPLLIFDLFLLKKLLQAGQFQTKSLMIFYWLNPILVYISYIHGQLDIVCITFLIFALFAIIKERTAVSAFFFSLALQSKFHVAIIFPMILAFIWNTHFSDQGKRKVFIFTIVTGALSLLGFIPQLLSEKIAYISVGSPEAMRVFTMNLVLGEGLTLYVGLGLFALLFGRLFFSSRISGEGLLFSTGLLLGALVLITNPSPGWYFWMFPFIALFYSRYLFPPKALFWTSVICYFIVFALPESLLPHLVKGIAFTGLQSCLVAILVYVFIFVIEREMPINRRIKPFLIGISGNSGAGKSTLSNILLDLFGRPTTQIVEGDDYHKWERGNENWQDYTHLHPRANNLIDLQHHMKELSEGKLVYYPHYDHSTGKFTEARPLRPARTLVIQGLHTFYMRSMRERFDLKIYLKPSENLRMLWKIQRDCFERGYSLEKVIESFKKREKDSVTHMDPQAEEADLIVIPDSVKPIEFDDQLQNNQISKEKPAIKVTYVLWNHFNLSHLISQLKQISTLEVSVGSQHDNLNRQSFSISGSISKEQIHEIAVKTIPSLRQTTRSRIAPQWHSNLDGVSQLVILNLQSV